MSFLAEILVSKGLADIEELNEKIQGIHKCITLLKEEVTLAIEDKYINYTCTHEKSIRLENKLKNLTMDIDDVKDRIEAQISSELTSSRENLESLSKALQEATLSYEFVSQLLKINTALEAAQNFNKDSNLLEIARQLKSAEEDLIKEFSDFELFEIFEALKSELTVQQRKHSCNTIKLWTQCLVWNESVVENQMKTVQLALKTDVDKEKLFRTLDYYDVLNSEMKAFSEKLFKDVLCPVISSVTSVDCEGSSTLTLRINVKEKNPICINVINNLTIIFNFLSLQLNLKSEDDLSLFCELKQQISDEFCSYLIKNCLSSTVPKKREELEAYKAIVEEITAFELLLKEIGFLAEDNMSIAEYANNVEELFASKTCEAYLAAARSIMKKDLHDIKQVGPVESDAPPDLEITVHLTELSPYTFQFPACQISKSTEELLDLVNEMLREVPQSTDPCAVRLFYTARNIFTMYCDVVPEFHSRLLSTIPQQSAILHNNAMYLAHQLMFLGPKYRDRLPPCLEGRTATFVDLIDSLRTLASDVFTNHLQAQKKQIIDTLRDSGLVTLSDSPKFPEGIEKAIRQCLRQLVLLQTVWQHILPVNTYCKALGLLCNAFVEEIVQKVLMAEDIPADTAAQLVVVFSLIQQKAPHVFPEALEIHRHVKKWSKFCELQLVLGAGLREMDDRWADGKGPLAQEFTPDQVRHLIRALFQISDRRAVLLAKII